MSAVTARRAGEVARLRPLGTIEVRGRAEPVEVFAAEELRTAIPAVPAISPGTVPTTLPARDDRTDKRA
jgi:hypothetical protein